MTRGRRRRFADRKNQETYDTLRTNPPADVEAIAALAWRSMPMSLASRCRMSRADLGGLDRAPMQAGRQLIVITGFGVAAWVLCHHHPNLPSNRRGIGPVRPPHNCPR